ncbi:MAG: hypothetical protein KKA07_07745 [Bacteroidetes bacterium]|nr:hypothetical protein [Bacteroidota bacterium]MBU1718955.1 hypothetical protein [Bacteroidota bacterium]
MKRFFSLILILGISAYGFSQKTFLDSARSIPSFKVFYAYQIPGGDIAKRFGGNSEVGGGFQWKSKGNLVFGFDFNFLFGGNVKESNIFDSIITTNTDGTPGYIIDGNGTYAELRLYERGYCPMIYAGKLFPLFGPNRNSGLVVQIGGGVLIHKIRIENPENVAPQIKDEYKKGYDRYSTGYSLSQFVGYSQIGNSRLLSFRVGFEFIQGWTVNRRFNFDLKSIDNTTHPDFLYGLKFTWMIPAYSRPLEKFYYN